MLEQYKKTFIRMQLAIWVIAIGAAILTHQWRAGVAFFVVTQVASVFGAMWASRLKRKFDRQANPFLSRT
jgi:CDP-diglyceride synthetase